jgi:hypothetical protein
LGPLSEKSGLSKFHILAIIAVVVLLIINLLGFDGIIVYVPYPHGIAFRSNDQSFLGTLPDLLTPHMRPSKQSKQKRRRTTSNG